MRTLSKYEINNLIGRYTEGDNNAADIILNQYDSLIKRTALDYFEGKLDLHIGWAIEDVIQFARLRILQAMKKLNLEKCPFPYFVKTTTIWACGRFIRYSKSMKRDHEKQVEYNGILALFIPDKSVNLPEKMAMEKELLEKVEAEVSKLDEVCQAVYQIAIEEREGVYNSKHPKLKNLGHGSMQIRLEKVRRAVRQVLESY